MLWMRLQAGNIRRLYEETTSVNASFPTPWPYRRRRVPFPPQATCCGWPGCPRGRNRTTYLQACHALWAVCEMGWTQTNTAFVLGINQTTVSRIVRGFLFRNARPLPIPGFARGMYPQRRQGEFCF